MMVDLGDTTTHSVTEYGDWERKFIFLKKIRNKWIFCKNVYMRRRTGYRFYCVQYALNDFDIIKSEQ